MPGSVPLLSYLITHARVLEAVSVPSIKGRLDQDHTLNALRLIIQHHRQHLPVISLSKTKILPSNLPALRELTEMGFTFQKFCVELEVKKINGPGNVRQGFNVQNIRKCLAWLASQSSRVTSLVLRFDEPYPNLSLAIPPLPLLTELELNCCSVSVFSDGPCPIQPLVNNPFPVLQKLTLISYKDSYGIFDQCCLPSVQRLYIDYSSPITIPWNTILPNLTFLAFEVESEEFFFEFEFEEDHSIQNLTFIFTHFSKLTDLVIKIGKDRDCWDILTGGSPQPISTDELLNGVMRGEPEPLEEPVDGVYQTPSLRNFRALKSLTCHPGTRSNLDAIIHMTRTGLVVPLEHVVLFDVNVQDFSIEFEELEAYQAELSKTHSKVDMVVKQLEVQDQVNWWKRYMVSPVLLQDYIDCDCLP